MRRALIAVLLVAGSMLLGAAPADAGGPTSVLLTNPNEARATAIYATDPRYAELETLLHSPGSTTSGAAAEAELTDATYLNVTWLAHDVSVWRTDQVRLDLSGEAWLASEGSAWARLGDGDGIRDLATSLGLIGGGSAPVTEVVPQTVPDAEPVAAAPPTSVVREETRWFSLAGWRWAVPGLLLGLVAAGLARRQRAGNPAPRQELIDDRPERVTSPG